MSDRQLVLEVALRESRARARTNVFKVITGFLVVVAIAGPTAVALWPDDDGAAEEVAVGLPAGSDPLLEQRVVALAQDRFDVDFVMFSAGSQAASDKALTDGDVDVVIESPATLVWEDEVDESLAVVLRTALQQGAALERGQGFGLSGQDVSQLFAPIDIEDRFVDEAQSSDFILGVAALGLFAAFLIPQVFGQLTMMSVIEEKSTGVVEVLLSHIRPRTLLLGKVLGLTMLAMGQIVVFLAGLTAAMLATDSLDVTGSVWEFAPVLAISLVGGLVLYNVLFALIGSLIARQEDASQVMLPVFVPLMVGFIFGQVAIGGRADSLIAKVLTFFPPTTPMLLPVRVARGAIDLWEVLVALGLLALAGWVGIRMAARVYEFTLLYSGSRVGWRQAWRFARGRPGPDHRQ